MSRDRDAFEGLVAWLEARVHLVGAVSAAVKDVVAPAAKSSECYCVRVCSVLRGWMQEADGGALGVAAASSAGEEMGEQEGDKEGDADEEEDGEDAAVAAGAGEEMGQQEGDKEADADEEGDGEDFAWSSRVHQYPLAPRGSTSKLQEINKERAAILEQRDGTWRQCRSCLWVRRVPYAGSRQLYCQSGSAGFKGLFRCGAQPTLAAWLSGEEVAQDAVKEHNDTVAGALVAVKKSMAPPTDKTSRNRFLLAVRAKVAQLKRTGLSH